MCYTLKKLNTLVALAKQPREEIMNAIRFLQSLRKDEDRPAWAWIAISIDLPILVNQDASIDERQQKALDLMLKQTGKRPSVLEIAMWINTCRH